MATLRTAVLAAAILLGLSGCDSVQDGRERGRLITSTQEPTFTAPVSTPAPSTSNPVRTTSTTASCGRRPWAFGFSPVEAASGNRYLSIQVRNCGTQRASVPLQPTITVRDADGNRVAVRWDWRPAKGSRVVAAGHDIWLQLHWLSSGRCERGGASLEVAVNGQVAHDGDCLQLGGLSGVTGEQASGDATWSSTSTF